jgi:hypothetical protein
VKNRPGLARSYLLKLFIMGLKSLLTEVRSCFVCAVRRRASTSEVPERNQVWVNHCVTRLNKFKSVSKKFTTRFSERCVGSRRANICGVREFERV